jgi:glucose-6-phosphate-specific signal transduction histidine kinase
MGEKHLMEVEEDNEREVKSHKVAYDLKNIVWHSDASSLHMKLSFPEHLVVEAVVDKEGVEEKTRIRDLNIDVSLLEAILNVVFSANKK